MAKQIAAISFIYLCVCAAWIILGSTVVLRTGEESNHLKAELFKLWGSEQKQEAPLFLCTESKIGEAENSQNDTKKGSVAKTNTEFRVLPIDSSQVNVALKLEQRKKGLLWYPTYKVVFAGKYSIANNSDQTKDLIARFKLADKSGIYDNFKIKIGNSEPEDTHPVDGVLNARFRLAPHSSENLDFSYDSMGTGSWRYTPGSAMSMARKFKLEMLTNFDAIDFPEGTRSPSSKFKQEKGWKLLWEFENTMAGSDIGMSMPRLLNPGPLVADVTFFAPVSLFFFFYVTWLTSTIRSIRLHPMHYFFIGAAFFSFHLLLAYSVDHIPVEWSFFICSLVSVFLVMSYASKVVADRLFVRQLALSQFIYLILFSYTFFLEQFTGLIITCMSIMTLFISMQYTVRTDWSRLLSGKFSSADDDLQLIEEAYTGQKDSQNLIPEQAKGSP